MSPSAQRDLEEMQGALQHLKVKRENLGYLAGFSV
jgi:hypothetical protein